MNVLSVGGVCATLLYRVCKLICSFRPTPGKGTGEPESQTGCEMWCSGQISLYIFPLCHLFQSMLNHMRCCSWWCCAEDINIVCSDNCANYDISINLFVQIILLWLWFSGAQHKHTCWVDARLMQITYLTWRIVRILLISMDVLYW